MEEQNIINFILSNKELPGRVTNKIESGSLFIEPLINGLQLEDGTPVRKFFAPSRYATNINKGDFIAFVWDNPGKGSVNLTRGETGDPIAKNITVISEEDIKRLVDEIIDLFSKKEKENLLNQLEERKKELEKEYKVRDDVLNQQSYGLALEKQKVDAERNKVVEAEIKLVQIKNELESKKSFIQLEKDDLIKRKQEISRYTALLSIVQNSSQTISLHSSIPKNIDLEPEDLGDLWLEMLASKNQILPNSTAIGYLISMITALCSGSIVLLNGTVGVGKTSMVRKSAELLGGKAEIIPIRPSWLDPSDLLGFFDPLAETFRPSTFTTALKNATESLDRPFLICLDELNLARIENYGADLLSTLEYSKNLDEIGVKKRSLSLYSQDIEKHLWRKLELLKTLDTPSIEQQLLIVQLDSTLSTMRSECELTQNLVLIGTLNSDETTYDLSPKVIDRSYTITYPPTDFKLKIPFYNEDEIYEQQLSVDKLQSKVRYCLNQIKEHIKQKEYPTNIFTEDSIASQLSNKFLEDWDRIIQWNEKYLSQLGISVGYRNKQDYLIFFTVSHCLGITKNNPNNCLAYFLFTKLLPRITFFKNGDREDLCKEWIDEISRSYLMGGNNYILEQLEHQISEKGRRIVRYWG